ncbi:hypothetical protein ACLB1E_16355 [Escherichia coli]
MKQYVVLMSRLSVACVTGILVRYLALVFRHFLGGPFRYIDSLGAGEVVAIMQRLATQYGSRFTPCERLVEMGARGESFWKTTATELQ